MSSGLARHGGFRSSGSMRCHRRRTDRKRRSPSCWSSGAAASHYLVPITAIILCVFVAVYLSYRQTIEAYPGGGGSYTVASQNLGPYPGLLAASALSLDYILNVAVGISAGVGAIVSAIPSLLRYTLPLGLRNPAVADGRQSPRHSGVGTHLPPAHLSLRRHARSRDRAGVGSDHPDAWPSGGGHASSIPGACDRSSHHVASGPIICERHDGDDGRRSGQQRRAAVSRPFGADGESDAHRDRRAPGRSCSPGSLISARSTTSPPLRRVPKAIRACSRSSPAPCSGTACSTS